MLYPSDFRPARLTWAGARLSRVRQFASNPMRGSAANREAAKNTGRSACKSI
jgi:hypothetical protein